MKIQSLFLAVLFCFSTASLVAEAANIQPGDRFTFHVTNYFRNGGSAGTVRTECDANIVAVRPIPNHDGLYEFRDETPGGCVRNHDINSSFPILVEPYVHGQMFSLQMLMANCGSSSDSFFNQFTRRTTVIFLGQPVAACQVYRDIWTPASPVGFATVTMGQGYTQTVFTLISVP